MLSAALASSCSAVALGVVLAQAPPVAAAGEEPAARDLMRRVFDQTRVSFVARMKLTSPGGIERILEVRHKQMPRASATYMEILSPFHMKGTRFLSWDRDGAPDEHYTYVPAVKRSVRVPEWTLKQPFLGSHFYMVDIAVPDMSEARFVLDGDSAVGGVPCKRVRSIPLVVDDDEPYSAVIYCVDVGRLISVSTEYFDLAGKLLKIWKPEKIENISGVWTPLLQTMRDVQANSESRLEILEIQMHVDLPDDIFRKSHLDR